MPPADVGSPKRRRLAGAAEARAARRQALEALLAARRVTEKGIDAYPPKADVEALPEPQAAAAAAIASWRDIEVRLPYILSNSVQTVT